MALITLGSPAIDRAAAGGGTFTVVTKANPANASGIITAFEIFSPAGMSNVQIGLFYVVSGNSLSTRSTANLGALGAGLQQVTGLNLAVQAGDYIGVYCPLDADDYDRVAVGGLGYWYRNDDSIPCTNSAFVVLAAEIVSFGATGTTIPTIVSLTPDHGRPGDSVVIAGTSFDPAQGGGGITFNGVAATVTAWADTEITVTVPAGATTGDVLVTNSTGGVSAAGSTWTLDPLPVITLLNPDHGGIGDSIVITGTDFEAVQGTGTVTFNGVVATVTAWADTQITATAPVGATTGPVVVTADAGGISAGVTWTLDSAASGASMPSLGNRFEAVDANAVLGHSPVRG